MGWSINPGMEWSTDGGSTWTKISDHGRAPISVSVERIENKQRMADGTLRRYVVTKKRTWSTSWENLPDKPGTFLANGKEGLWLEDFHKNTDGAFLMRLRSGDQRDQVLLGTNGTVVTVMITDFSKEITKRGTVFDLWSVDIELTEV